MLVLNRSKSRIRIIRGIDSEAKYITVRGYPAKLMVWAVWKDFKRPFVRVTASLTAIGYQNLQAEYSLFELLNGWYGKAASFSSKLLEGKQNFCCAHVTGPRRHRI